MNKTKVIKAFNELLKEDESLKYALATNLAKYGRPQSKKSDKPADLTKGLEKGREKYVKDLKKAGLDEAAPVSVNINMDQAEAIYKILADNFGEEHIKDMFTLGSLSLYNMLVKGGIAGVQENINEDKADAIRWFGNLKYYYQKGLSSPDLKDPADKAEYKKLAKDFFSRLEEDNKARSISEQPDVLNKIADMFDRKYPHLKFDVNTMFDRIDVSGDSQDVFTFGEELAGEKIFDYEIINIDKEGRQYTVRIVRSDSIGRNAVNPTNEAVVDYDFSESELIEVLRQLKRRAGTEVNMIRAFTKALGRELSDDEIRGYQIDPNLVAKASMEEEKPGLWANIRAKQERGEKPARKGSKAYKIAKKAGDEINKEK